MDKPTQSLSKLLRFMRGRVFVRFTRPYEEGFVRGYVLDVGPKFFLIALQSDQIRLDGFSCYRITDVKNLMRDPYAAFAEEALKKLKQRMPKKPKVNIANVEKLLLSASRVFPLVTIHREKSQPEVCWIGVVEKIKGGQVSLLEIGPNAKWDRKPNRYKLSEITAVEFGGEYETALHLVGGRPRPR